MSAGDLLSSGVGRLVAPCTESVPSLPDGAVALQIRGPQPGPDALRDDAALETAVGCLWFTSGQLVNQEL